MGSGAGVGSGEFWPAARALWPPSAMIALAVILLTSAILKFTWYDHLKKVEQESAIPAPSDSALLTAPPVRQ